MTIPEHIFSEDEVVRLKEYRDNQPDFRLKIRFISLLMLASGADIETVASAVGKCSKTVENWLRIYLSEGIGSLNSFDYKPKKSYLSTSEINQVIIFVIWENPSTLKEIREYIEEKFGITYNIETVRQLLKKHNLKVIRPKIIPGNTPAAEEQKKFIEEYEILKSSAEPGTKILFGDAMHLIHQNVPSYCWGDPAYPPVLETNSGRKRLNILGAYDPDTYSLIHLTGEENCNAERVIKYFDKILNNYLTAPKIYIILDNARYFHANLVKEHLEKHPKINLIFLPPYAPNLNLIERLWRVAKKELVRNKYYKEYKTFRAKVFQFLNNTDSWADQLKTLMVEKFEIVYA